MLAITPGEPAGIGPDVTLAALAQCPQTDVVIFANQALMQERAKQLNLPCNYPIEDVPLSTPVIPGQLNPASAAYVLACLDQAIDACQSKICRGLVTGPIHKSLLNDAGIAFTGHTEYLAMRTNTARTVMSFIHPRLKVALQTTHCSLAEVPQRITKDRILETLLIISEALPQLFSAAMSIDVLGLNPHAGEAGHLGREELDDIIPAIEAAKQLGLNVNGPYPADTAFCQADPETMILGMYHDQVLPVIKSLGFGEAVNLTLGLPFVRCSVDHGTALNLAASGKADPQGMRNALQLAHTLTQQVTQ